MVRPMDLSDYKGKKIYLKFWASWCSICLANSDTDEIAKDAGDNIVDFGDDISWCRRSKRSSLRRTVQGLDYKKILG